MAVIPYAAIKRSALKREGDTALCDPGDRQDLGFLLLKSMCPILQPCRLSGSMY